LFVYLLWNKHVRDRFYARLITITPERNPMKRIVLAAGIAAVCATPALADFFIVREGPTGTCRVVETRPTDTKIVVVGNKAYKVRAEAEKEIAVVCK
jgi:hypothetical protein